jgi:hypothetical protein
MMHLEEVAMRHILLALVVLFPISSDAWAWGDEGHKIICEIAFRLVQPSTRAEIQKLIGTDNSSTPSVIPAPGRITHGKERASTF